MKNKQTAYLLWIIGLHGYYLEKPWTTNVIYISLITCFVLIPFTLGLSVLAFLFIWLADLVLIPKWVDEINEKERNENA